MSPDVWCSRHNTFAVACCECRNDKPTVAPKPSTTPVFGTAVGALRGGEGEG